ncbi:MAG: hypothetical protein KDD56_01955 [Bdellovibrionales bacterium]|nr:hypothetical protein [Bdellovibrionales bacterium]
MPSPHIPDRSDGSRTGAEIDPTEFAFRKAHLIAFAASLEASPGAIVETVTAIKISGFLAQSERLARIDLSQGPGRYPNASKVERLAELFLGSRAKDKNPRTLFEIGESLIYIVLSDINSDFFKSLSTTAAKVLGKTSAKAIFDRVLAQHLETTR